MAKINKKDSRIRRHYRVRATVSGTETRPRLAVYRSNKAIYVQVIDDINAKTLASSSTKTLKLVGNNIENSKKVGLDIAAQMKKLKIDNVVFDRGGYLYHGKVKAIAEEVRNQGIKI